MIRGTLEERILEMARSKLALSEDVGFEQKVVNNAHYRTLSKFLVRAGFFCLVDRLRAPEK